MKNIFFYFKNISKTNIHLIRKIKEIKIIRDLIKLRKIKLG